MKRALLALLVAAGCNPKPAEPVRAGDAGYVYSPSNAAAAEPVLAAPAGDAGARPSVELVAGQPGGRGDLDGKGEAARLGLVGGMARVGDTVVFADEGNGSIRSFTPATGAVETLARLPVVEGGRPALPAFVAYDGKGRLFVTDRAGQVIYALDLDARAFAIVAGKPGVRGGADGPLAEALFDAPTGLAFDGGHTLFVADVGNRHVRKIDLAAGVVSTLPPSFLQVWGLCMNGPTLYATDNLDEAVLRVDTMSGQSTLLAGTGRFGYFGPADGVGIKARFREPRGVGCGKTALYVADRGNSSVRRLDLASLVTTTLAGHGSGNLGFRDGYGPDALFADVQSVLEWDDTLYIGEEATLRALSLRDAVLSTVAGAPDQTSVALEERTPLVRPEGLAIVPEEGAAYVATCGSSSLHRIDLVTHAVTPVAGSALAGGFVDGTANDARFSCASAVTYDGQGNLFVADRNNHSVRGVRTDTRRVVTVAGTLSRCGNDDGPFASATFCDPAGLAFGADQLFVADAAAQTIRRVDFRQRSVTTLAGAPFAAGNTDGAAKTARFASPSSIVFRAGVLFVADRENGSVRRVDAATGDVTTLAGARFERPRALAVSFDGALLVADARGVWRVPLSGGEATRIVQAGRGLRLGAGSDGPVLSVPVGIAEIAPGDALLLDRAENALVRLRY